VQRLRRVTYTELADTRTALAEALQGVGRLGWPDDQSPFPGLRPFDLELRQVFFGRAADVTRLSEFGALVG
jgi:hypothetical protein